MINRFCKISTDFTFDFDIEHIISKFVGDLNDPDESNLFYPKPFNSPTGVLHWQHFLGSNSRFARNVYRNLRMECDSIVNSLTRLQKKIEHSDNVLINQFLKHKFTGNRISIIKQTEGHSVNPHVDSHRSLALNIGFKNSSTCKTWVGDQSCLEHFDNQCLESYVMQDGDVYLLNTSLTHSVESLVTDRDRYIITYTVI